MNNRQFMFNVTLFAIVYKLPFYSNYSQRDIDYNITINFIHISENIDQSNKIIYEDVGDMYTTYKFQIYDYEFLDFVMRFHEYFI